MENIPNTTQTPVTTVPPTSSPRKFRVQKKFVIAAAIVLLIVIAIPLTVFFTQKQQETKSTDVILATIGEKNIFRSSVRDLALEQYTEEGLTPQILEQFYETLIKRNILDIEAQKLGITVSQEEINTEAENNTEKTVQDVAKYTILENKIMASQLRSVEAYAISFWIPSFEYPQLPEYDVQREEVKVAMNDMQERLESGETPLAVTKYTATTYPDLPRLALNGWLFASTDESDPAFTKPRLYALSDTADDEASNSYNPDVYEALRTIQPGQVKQAHHRNGSGGTVLQAVSVSSGEFATLDAFFEAKKKEYVTIHNPL